MGFFSRIGEKIGITSRPATAEEVAEIEALRGGPAAEAAPEPYAYQEHQHEHGHEYGIGHLRKPVIEVPAKPSLFDRIADRFSKPKVEARDQIIDQKPETPSLLQKCASRISSAVSAATESVSSKFKKDDVLELTKSMMMDREPSLWDRVKNAGAAVGNAAQITRQSLRESIKAAGPSFREGVREAGHNIGQSSKNVGRSLSERVKAVGQSLKNPETRKQVAAELGLNMAVMGGAKIAAGTVMAGAGAPVLATFAGMTATTALVGGLMKSRRQYMQASQEGERSFKAFASHVWENRKQFTKNMAGSALVGALGSVAGGLLGEAWNHFHSAAPVSVPAAHDVVQNVSDVPVAPEVPVYQAPSQLEEAIKIVREHRFLSEETIALAQKGDASAIKDIAHAINTDGILADDHLVKPLLEEAGRQADAAPAVAPTPAPVTTLTSVPVAPAVAPNTHLLDDVMSSISEAAESEAAQNVAIATGAAATATATVVAANALPALALVTAEPKMDTAPPRIAQICQMRDMENANQIGLRCPETPAFVQIRPGDTLRIQYTDSVKNISSSIDIRNPAAIVATKEYEASMANDGSFMSSVRDQLRGYISEKFNRASGAVMPAPVAANENELPPVAISDNSVAAPAELKPETFKDVFTKWTMEQASPAPASVVSVIPTYSTNLFGGQNAVNDDVLATTGQIPLAGVSPK